MRAAPAKRQLERVLVGVIRRLEGPLARILDTPVIHRRLHTSAVRAWRAPAMPLILCQGNINRSPFAEHLARQRPGSAAASAGFEATSGRRSPERTVTLAAAYGVDLTTHRSRLTDDQMIGATNAIFIFDLQNLARVLIRYPRVWRRVHFVGALSHDGAVVIRDPHGHGQAVLERSLGEIADAIRAVDGVIVDGQTPTERGGRRQ
jgi:protein-tyrosine phosphatase